MATADAKAWAEVFSAQTGIPTPVVLAWIACESAGGEQLAGAYNYLNLGNPSYVFPSNGVSAAKSAQELNGGPNWAGIRAAIATKDGSEIIEAIVESPWAEGHYGAALQTPSEMNKRTGYPIRAYRNSCIFKSWDGAVGATGGVVDDTDVITDPIQELIDVFTSVGKFFSILLQKMTWVRIGYIIGGVILVAVAVNMANRDLFGKTTSDANGIGKLAAKTVAAAAL